MQMMLQRTRPLSRPSGARMATTIRVPSGSRQRVRATAQTQQQGQQATDSSTLMPLLLSGALFSSTPLAAWADETAAPVEAATGSVQQAAAAVTEAAAEAAPAPTWLSYVVVLTPIILYAIFNVYRSQVNPRIKFSDFLFICAGVAVVANLVSIIGFKVRLF